MKSCMGWQETMILSWLERADKTLTATGVFVTLILWIGGRHPSEKTAFTETVLFIYGKGMTPIEKNIIVVDEQGNEYEATYPKRARGLVKNGRARFLSENMICLACPPEIQLEDNEMTNIEMADNKAAEAGLENNVAEAAESFGAEGGAGRAKRQERTGTAAPVDVAYILAQVKAIQDNTAYLSEAISALAGTYGSDDGDNGGNTAEVRAEALGNIVRFRETTNQQLLDFYRTVYIDLKSQP